MQALKTLSPRPGKLVPLCSAGLVAALALTLVWGPSLDPLSEAAPASPTPVPGSTWEAGPDPLHLPEGLPSLGNQHGDIAISSKGDIYVSLMQGLRGGVQVYAADGTYLRNLPEAPLDFHGFVIQAGDDGEFLYGPQLGAGKIVKMTLEGKVVMTIPGESIPKKYWQVNPKNQEAALRLTGCAVAPNGDIFVTDGYASDYVHRFNAKGEYLASFGGKEAPYHFKTLHKIAIDPRFDPPRLVGTDRANNRVVHLSLEGELLGEIATDLLLPAAAVVQGDYLAVGELKGRLRRPGRSLCLGVQPLRPRLEIFQKRSGGRVEPLNGSGRRRPLPRAQRELRRVQRRGGRRIPARAIGKKGLFRVEATALPAKIRSL